MTTAAMIPTTRVTLRRTSRPARVLAGLLSLTVTLLAGIPAFPQAVAAEQQRIRYFHPDHLGSTHLVTDENGNVIERVQYKPFGEVYQREIRNPVTGQLIVADEASRISPFGYTGQRHDTSTGLYFYGGRYYDPQLGRFTQPDPFVQHPADPQLLNRYAYVRNNPVNFVDPSGHFIQFVIAAVWAIAQAAMVSAAIGAAVNAGIAAFRGEDIGQAAIRGAKVGAVAGAILGGGGFLIGGQVLGLTGAAKTLAELGFSAVSGGVGGGLDSHLQGGSFGDGVGTGILGGIIGYGVSRALGAVSRTSVEPGNPTQVGNQIALAQQSRQFLNKLGLGAQSTGDDAFDDIMRQVDRADVSTPPNGAVVWTGLAQGNQTAAMAWARQTGRFTIEMTPGGRWLTSLDLFGPTSPFSNVQADTVWRRLSQRFAQAAQGEVNAFLKGTSFNTRSVFYRTELPALYGNSRVSQIRIRDQ